LPSFLKTLPQFKYSLALGLGLDMCSGRSLTTHALRDRTCNRNPVLPFLSEVSTFLSGEPLIMVARAQEGARKGESSQQKQAVCCHVAFSSWRKQGE